MTLYPAIVQMLGGASLAGAAASLALLAGLVLPAGRRWLRTSLAGYERHVIGWAWTIAFIATAGSLYFSEMVGFVPCPFCWYQRFAMYPLVLVLGVGLARAHAGIWRFALPLPVAGLAIAAYHVALQFQPTLDLVPCEGGGTLLGALRGGLRVHLHTRHGGRGLPDDRRAPAAAPAVGEGGRRERPTRLTEPRFA